jgi:transcriptional regulator with XRE-family HTH domain
MPVLVDVQRIRTLAAARGLGPSLLANRAGLSRQGLHRLLHGGHRPLANGLESLASALGVDALSLLCSSEAKASDWERIRPLLEAAAGGDPRAFEELPAAIDRPKKPAGLPETLTPVQHQILAAAGELTAALWPRRWLPGFVAEHASQVPPTQAFLFGGEMIGLQRLDDATPEPMRRHRVFGAFRLADFARHGRKR